MILSQLLRKLAKVLDEVWVHIFLGKCVPLVLLSYQKKKNRNLFRQNYTLCCCSWACWKVVMSWQSGSVPGEQKIGEYKICQAALTVVLFWTWGWAFRDIFWGTGWSLWKSFKEHGLLSGWGQPSWWQTITLLTSNLPHIHPIHNSQHNFWSYGQDKKEAQLNKIQRFRKLTLR